LLERNAAFDMNASYVEEFQAAAGALILSGLCLKRKLYVITTAAR
jgi:hypothetical protein